MLNNLSGCALKNLQAGWLVGWLDCTFCLSCGCFCGAQSSFIVVPFIGNTLLAWGLEHSGLVWSAHVAVSCLFWVYRLALLWGT